MDKTKKKSVKRYVLWGTMALVVLLLAIMPLMARQQQAEDGPQVSILSTTAEKGTVRTNIHGGGTLAAGDPENIELPRDVKIREFLVKNGEMVKEGQPLAEVDKVSVLTAISEIQKSMTTVKKQLSNTSDEKAEEAVTAVAGGRVKIVYAQKDDAVEDVMLKHGALAVLSLDGKMCVRFQVKSELSAGEAVKVKLDNGTEVTGTVESNLDGELVITVEDKGYEVGQTVTVEDVGQGTLEIHSPWQATAFTGIVRSVNAKPERVVSSGSTLFGLKDTDYVAKREILANNHREYEELLQKLFKMYETGYIAAPCDGMISGIDEDTAHLLSGAEEDVIAQPLAVEEDRFQLVLLSELVPLEEAPEDTCTGDGSCPLEDGDPNHDPKCPKACNEKADCKAKTHKKTCPALCISSDVLEKCPAINHKKDCISACKKSPTEEGCTAEKHQLGCIRSCIESDGKQDCPALIHKTTCIKKCTHEDDAKKCKAERYHYADCINSCIETGSATPICPATKHKKNCYYLGATYTAQVFKVGSVGDGALVGFIDPTIYAVEKTLSGWVRSDGQPFNQSLLTKRATMEAANAQMYQEGDILLFITMKKGDETQFIGIVLLERPMVFQMPTFSFSMPSVGGSTQTQLYSLVEDVLMTVTPQDTMTLTIAVDESDVLNMETGLTAEITVNALPGEVFEGTISKVAAIGGGNGGNSKFNVEIQLPRGSEMLAGMSASAVITLSEKQDVLLLPAAALTEEGEKTIVYTQLDKKTGEPAGPVEVTTGISDGEMVEILSGLNSGDTVYYAYYDTVEESDAVELERMKMH